MDYGGWSRDSRGGDRCPGHSVAAALPEGAVTPERALDLARAIAARAPHARVSLFESEPNRTVPLSAAGRAIRIEGCPQGDAIELAEDIAVALHPALSLPATDPHRVGMARYVSWRGGFAFVSLD
jgi:hypothetical protein